MKKQFSVLSKEEFIAAADAIESGQEDVISMITSYTPVEDEDDEVIANTQEQRDICLMLGLLDTEKS